MTDGPSNPLPGAPASLVDRVKNILITPKTEWQRIAAEPNTVSGLFTGYAMILAAIPLIAGIIGSLAFATSVGGITYRPPMAMIIVMGVVGYIIQIAVVYVMGLIINALSPGFTGTTDKLSAFKLSVYCTTPVWVAGILSIFPPLAPLALLSYLYVIFLIYLGVGPVLKIPEDKSVVVTLVIVGCYILLVIVLSMVLMGILMGVFASMFMAGAASMPTM